LSARPQNGRPQNENVTERKSEGPLSGTLTYLSVREGGLELHSAPSRRETV